MNGPDINTPFAQALIAEGQKRGRNPFDIAAAIGNAYQENSLRTDGLPGDNGTAFGGMQWRGTRFDALKAQAQKMGLPWNDPRVQASHWYNEQDAADNKGAANVDDANDNAIDSLQPGGWKSSAPTNEGVMGYAQRLQASQAALAALNPDAPSAGAQETSGSGTPGADGFVIPGAAQGTPQAAYEPTMGDRLNRLSAALLRRDSPGAAAAIDNSLNTRMAQQAAFLKAQQTSNKFSLGDKYQNKDGTWMQDKTDTAGNSTPVPVPASAIPSDEEKPPTRQEVQAQAARTQATQNIGQIEPNLDQIDEIRDALMNGRAKLGPDASIKMIINNLTGNSDGYDRLLKKMESTVITSASAMGSTQKGTLTNQKFQKDIQAVMPSFAGNDVKAAYEALTRVREGLANAYNANATSIVQTAKQFNRLKDVPNNADGTIVDATQYYPERMKFYHDRHQAMKDREAEFMASPGRGQAPAIKAPDVGFTKGGYRYMGGDPSSQSSWQKAE